MSSPVLTIGGFLTAIVGIKDALNNLANDISLCNLETEVDGTPGRRVICQIPIIGGAECMAPVDEEPLTLSDLHDAVTGLKGWIEDIETTLGGYDLEAPLDEGLRPPADMA